MYVYYIGHNRCLLAWNDAWLRMPTAVITAVQYSVCATHANLWHMCTIRPAGHVACVHSTCA